MSNIKTLDQLMTEWEQERLADISRAEAEYEAGRVRRQRERMRVEAQILREIADGVRNPDGSLIEEIEDDGEDE